VPEPTIFSLVPDTAIVEVCGRGVVLRTPRVDVVLGELTPELLSALRTLGAGGATVAQLVKAVSSEGGAAALARFYKMFRMIDEAGLICQTILSNGQRFATITTSRPPGGGPASAEPNTKYTLSRFAYCHREGDSMMLESPLSGTGIILHSWRAAAMILALAKPHTLDEMYDAVPGTDKDVTGHFMGVLLKAGMLSAVDEDGNPREDENAAARWEFHDLLFHARSREGRHRYPYGRVQDAANLSPDLPSEKIKASGDVIRLYRPNPVELETQAPSVTDVMERRVSARRHGKTAMTDQQLGEFLFRVAGERRVEAEDGIQLSRRPYPSAGAVYELELYLVINDCQGIRPGVYHYDPREHRLYEVHAAAADTKMLFAKASRAAEWPEDEVPQVLIVITARVQKLFQIYKSIAYALTLKNLGVLYQTLYLVATAMNLAPCAVGGVDSDLFSRMTGLDYYAEPALGEFILGSSVEV
jgi:SagB-type dehydrogenase family enzyme